MPSKRPSRAINEWRDFRVIPGSVISRNGYQLKGQQSCIGNQINDGAILKVEC